MDAVDAARPFSAQAPDGRQLQSLYHERFTVDGEYRARLWHVLCQDYFQQFVQLDDTVVELAAGYCEFINAIQAGTKIAVDLNPDVVRHAGPGVDAVVSDTSDMAAIRGGTADVVFVSNFFEHLTRGDILRTLGEARRILRPGGRLLVLQPNIRYCARDYWMFFDHVTALDDRSLREALLLAGFTIDSMLPRFLPYTTKSRIPQGLALVRLYLKVPLAWRLMGQQALAVARSPLPA